MFPLRTPSLPANADALRTALEAGLREVLNSAAAAMVTIEDRKYPDLATIRICIDEASIGNRPPRFRAPAGKLEPALQVGHFEVSGRPIHLQNAAIDLRCVAEDVKIGQSRDREGNLLLLLQNAASGKVELSIPVRDLNELMRSAVSAAAAEQGVIVEEFDLNLRAEHERALALEARIRARKLFLSTEVCITGKVEIDQQLNARISALECFAEGTLGTLACGFLAPHLQRFNDRSFSLLGPPLGELKPRNIEIAVDDELRIRAQFGSESAA